MAAGTISKPGTEYGPCTDLCRHADCIANRAIADSVCPLCGHAIGYDTRFYLTDGVSEHAVCVETRIEEQQRQRDIAATVDAVESGNMAQGITVPISKR